jgi:hypothetical protein
MVKVHWLKRFLVLGLLVWAMGTSFVMAANALGGLVGRNAIVSGAGALASGSSPALIKVSLAGHDEAKQAQLELSVTPVTVASDEAYLVIVTQINAPQGGDSGRELGSFSFFPPPRQGETRRFYVDLPTISREMLATGQFEAELSIALVSVDRAHPLVSSSVRVVGARIVEA